MNQRIILTISIAGLLVMITAVGFGCGLKSNTGTTQTTDTTQQAASTTDTTGSTTGTSTDTTTQTGTTQDTLTTTAEKFVATFGTFNSEGNFKNITDVYSYMSEKYRQDSASFVTQKQAAGNSGNFYETVTTVLMSHVLENTETTASVLVDTYRESSSSTAGRTSTYENIVVRFVQENGSWKVDKAEWQGK